MTHHRAIERSGRTLLAVLVGVFVLLAVVVFWVWRRPAPTQPDVDQGRAVAQKFLDLIRNGQPQQAWESTTAEFKSAEGRESFLRYVKKHAVLTKPLAFASVQTVNVQDSPRAEYVYRPADGKGAVRLLVANELGTWHVDRIAID
jgi:hypothetical protein